MFSQVLTDFKEPETKTYIKHLLIDFRNFKDQIDDELKILLRFTEQGFAPYENVISVELKAVSFPKIDNEVYYILDIDEFSGRLDSTDNTGSHNSFAIIYYDNSGNNVGFIKPMKGKDFDEKTHIFNPIEKRINYLNISFKKFGGNIIKKSEINSSLNTETFLNTYPISILLEFTMKLV